jgi:hypothetical protein
MNWVTPQLTGERWHMHSGCTPSRMNEHGARESARESGLTDSTDCVNSAAEGARWDGADAREGFELATDAVGYQRGRPAWSTCMGCTQHHTDHTTIAERQSFITVLQPTIVVAAPREFPGRARTLPPDAYAQAWAQASGADLLRNAKDGAMQAPAIAR